MLHDHCDELNGDVARLKKNSEYWPLHVGQALELEIRSNDGATFPVVAPIMPNDSFLKMVAMSVV